MELKNLMKEVIGVLGNSGAKKASIQLHLNLENEKVEVSPYGTVLSFRMKQIEEKK